MPRASPPKRRAAARQARTTRRPPRVGLIARAGRTMRECREVIDLLTEYLEGGLTQEEARRLEGHLANCDGCSGFLASLRTVRAAAGTAKADSVPEDCRRALRSFLETRLKPPKR